MKKITTTESANHATSMYPVCALVFSLLIGAGVESAAAGAPAIKGYDSVAYYTMMKAVKGSESIHKTYLGENWFFVNEEHKALFSADPMRYLPNYGGYCSYDLEPYSEGRDHRHKIDPTAWRIVDGELYLFRSEKTANHAIPTEKWGKVKAGLSQ